MLDYFSGIGCSHGARAAWRQTKPFWIIGDVIGLIVFFIGVGLTQILLVLKKKQVEKVQAAEGI
mgnify:CR=1 FL=1